MMKRLILVVVLVCGTLVAGGCGATAKFTYPADASKLLRVGGGPRTQLTVAVEPFTDFRGNDNSSMWAMYMIPLMPYGWVDYDRPDAGRMFVSIGEFEMDVSEDLAKAAALSLKTSGLFRDAFFSFGGITSTSADIIVRGQVNRLQYNGKLITYGLSFWGPYLWLFGLPAGHSGNQLALEIKFVDSKTRKVLLRHTVNKKWSKTQGLYYSMGHDCRGFAIMMQEAMNELVRRLDTGGLKTLQP